MVRTKQATTRTETSLDTKTTRLPLALKPSNSIKSMSMSSSNETLSSTTSNTDIHSTLSSINQPPSSSTLPKETNLSSLTTTQKKTITMKKTKSVSKAHIIESKPGEEETDSENGAEAQYDLATSIEETGGVQQFLKTPCMTLYKNYLTNQVDLEEYVLKHLSSYSKNECLFAGIKGTDQLKQKVNEFYHQNRRKSRNSTILFKGHSSRTTVTQQIVLQNGNLYLYVDGVMKNKTSKNKKKKLSIDIDADTSETMNDATIELEGEDEDEQLQSASTGSTDNVKSRRIKWRGGSKNCGLYLLLNKNEEVKECINNVLSYSREHGVLLTGIQLKTILDIQNVEMTKDRANAIVQIIASCVDVVDNPHFLAPRAQKPLFEYYGESFELGAVSPIKSIPIPKMVMTKFKEKENEKRRPTRDDKNGKDQEELCLKMVKDKNAQNDNNEDDNESMEVDDSEEVNEHDTSSIDNKQDNTKENQELNEKTHTLADTGVLFEEPANNTNISLPLDHLKGTAINNHHEDVDDDTGANSTPIETSIKDAVERCVSPGCGKTDSSITIIKKSRLSPLSDSNSAVFANDQTPLSDTSRSTSSQYSNTVDSTTKVSPLRQQQSTSPRSKQQAVSDKSVDTVQAISKTSKRRSFGLRSKTETKQSQSSTITPIKNKQRGHHTNTAPPADTSKKRKMNNDNKKPTENYQTLTKKLGKIPKKTHTS